jgi:hypothetical protein
LKKCDREYSHAQHGTHYAEQGKAIRQLLDRIEKEATARLAEFDAAQLMIGEQKDLGERDDTSPELSEDDTHFPESSDGSSHSSEDTY